jgi:hypothetical protein
MINRIVTLRQTGSTSAKFLIGLIVIIAMLLGALVYRRPLLDDISLYHYQPPIVVSQLATQTTMTAAARRVFYVNHPDVEAKASFANNCPSGTEQTVVLGCYHSDQAGIYLLQVSDPQLNGVEQVTAAHETLHAEYDRLSTAKRTQVDGWLEAYYAHGLTNMTIEAQIASYRKTEPDAVVNEMHSLFGTEVANLPPQLEAYYTQYFTNRAAVVADYNKYQVAFSSRIDAIAADDSQLTAMKTKISNDEASLQSQQAAISAQQQMLSQERSANDITAYNSSVASYNARINAYNSQVEALHAEIDSYNLLVSTRNGLALEEQQLAQALSGNSVPAEK